MSQNYYIVDDKSRKGPYDLMALVRKIRNGSLTANSILQLGEADSPKQAKDFPSLAEFFQERKDDSFHVVEHSPVSQSLGKVLKNGWYFLQNNQYSTIFSALLTLIIIILIAFIHTILPQTLRPFAYIGCFILGHFMVSCYMLLILRMARGQPSDIAYLKERINPAAKPLLLSSLIVCILASIGLALLMSSLPQLFLLIGLFIFAVPGLYVLSIYIFAPLLVLDQGYSMRSAMEQSRKRIMQAGMESSGIIYALLVINFIAGMFALLPMALTLPITLSALTEYYDELFS